MHNDSTSQVRGFVTKCRAVASLTLLCLGCQQPDLRDGGFSVGGLVDAGAGGDPCAPAGHVHRDPTGDWCHCDRGHVASEVGLGCEVDPDFTGNITIDLAGTAERACWHASAGPFATATDDGGANAFLTLYTLDLAPEGDRGLRSANVRYVAAVGGAHVATLSADVTLTVRELRPDGTETAVPVLVTQVTNVCPRFAQQFGFELTKGVAYRLVFGPSLAPQVDFLVDQVR
jgi:hypothetical protein